MAIDLGRPGGFSETVEPSAEMLTASVEAYTGAVEAPTTSSAPEVVPTSTILLEEYEGLRQAVARISRTEAQEAALPDVQDYVVTWLEVRRSEFRHPEVDDHFAEQTEAAGRVPALTGMLRWAFLAGESAEGVDPNPAGINGYELDASEVLVEAARLHQQEVVAGMTTPDTFPALGPNAEAAFPILRLIPMQQRAAFFENLPPALRQLVPPPEISRAVIPSLLDKARAIGRSVAEWVRHPRFIRQAVGQTALATEVAVQPVIVVEAAETAESQGAERFIDIPGVGRLKLVSYFDHPDHAGLTDRIDQGQRAEYKGHGVWKAEVEDKGPLARGDNVEIVALLDPETDEIVASLRKIHTTEEGGILELPSVKKFSSEEALDPAKYEEFEQTAEGREVVEIASLWKKKKYSPAVTAALYKEALHRSIERGEPTPEGKGGEVWVMGVVEGEFRLLIGAFGPNVVRVMGSKIAVDDGMATDRVRLTPVYLDPRAYFDDMMDQVDAARVSSDIAVQKLGAQREVLLWQYLEGLDRNRLRAETLGRLGAL